MNQQELIKLKSPDGECSATLQNGNLISYQVHGFELINTNLPLSQISSDKFTYLNHTTSTQTKDINRLEWILSEINNSTTTRTHEKKLEKTSQLSLYQKSTQLLNDVLITSFHIKSEIPFLFSYQFALKYSKDSITKLIQHFKPQVNTNKKKEKKSETIILPKKNDFTCELTKYQKINLLSEDNKNICVEPIQGFEYMELKLEEGILYLSLTNYDKSKKIHQHKNPKQTQTFEFLISEKKAR